MLIMSMVMRNNNGHKGLLTPQVSAQQEQRSSKREIQSCSAGALGML